MVAQARNKQTAGLQGKNPNAPTPMVQQAAQQNFALKQGTVAPIPATPVQQPVGGIGMGNRVMGRFEQQVQQPPMQGASGSPVAPVGNVGIMREDTSVPDPLFGTQGVRMTNPAATSPNDQGSLSEALKRSMIHRGQSSDFNPDAMPGKAAPSGYGRAQPSAAVPNIQMDDFKKDDAKRDGGFFGWLRGIFPKSRPGMRKGETEEDYDRRMTTNRERMIALADAMRHIGNIVNTSKYAPAQQFNDPVSAEEAKYQQREAERKQQAAIDADAAYKQAGLTLKQQAAEADRQYKMLSLQLGIDKANEARNRNADKDAFDREKFEHTKEQDKVKNRQTDEKIKISRYNATHKGKGGRSGNGGSGGKYWFDDKDGKRHYYPNKTMYEQGYYMEYGTPPNGGTSTSTSTKTIDSKGNEKTITTRTKGSSIAQQAAKSQTEARAKRKNQTARGKSKLRNTAGLGL